MARQFNHCPDKHERPLTMPNYKSTIEKHERTSAVAASVIETERLARQQKTERLRALRLAKETVEKVRPKRNKPVTGKRGAGLTS